MTDTFNDVVIDGVTDTTQLTVQGHSTQTEPLQQWENSAGAELARVTGDGRLQVGSFSGGEMATDDSLIEAHRSETDTSKPPRGLHLLGAITGNLSSIISWVVQELVLKGTGGISALHSALRVKLTNENTGTMSSGADLRAGDFEAINKGGGSGNLVPEMTGLQVAITNDETGYLDTAFGVRVKVNKDPGGTLNKVYAIHADDGIAHFAQEFEIPVLGSEPADNPPTDFIKLYAKLDAGDPKLYAKDDNGDEHELGGSGGVAGSDDYILIEDQKPSGTGGGTFTQGDWRTRDLNMKVKDSGSHASILRLVFTSGSVEPSKGDTLSGATSNVTAVVVMVELTSGTWAGGDAAGNIWIESQTGTFQSENLDNDTTAATNIATISADSVNDGKVRLEAGTYRFSASAPAFGPFHKLRLENISDSTTIHIGTSERANSSNNVQTRSFIRSEFIIASDKTVELQHRIAANGGTFGLATSFGVVEVYAVLELWRVG